MIQLGVNSVLFGGYDFDTAARMIAACGYDGLEISAIAGMCEHIVLDKWEEQAEEVKATVAKYGLTFLSMEVASQDEDRLRKAFAASRAIGNPIVNIGPGGKMNEPGDLEKSIENINRLAAIAQEYGVTLCCKAHVGNAIFNTPTTLAGMERIANPAFGVDMDPSHIYRAGENPEEALSQVISRVKHIHIRDCKGRQQGPGVPPMQACGRGDINLMGYCEVMVKSGYDGPVCLEVIGANAMPLPEVTAIAAESYGYLNACLKHLGAR